MKNDNKSVVTGVLFFASLIVLVYTMLELRQTIWAVLGASVFFLVMTGVMIQQAGIAIKAYQKKQTMLLDSRLTELQNQLVMANEESQKSAKANVFYTKKIGEALAGFEDELLENQKKGNVLLQRVITTQTKSTKVLVKYNEINTNKVVSNVHNQYQQIEQSLDNSMSNTNVELRKIGENIMMIQRTPQTAAYQPVPPELLAQMTAVMSQKDADSMSLQSDATAKTDMIADENMQDGAEEIAGGMPLQAEAVSAMQSVTLEDAVHEEDPIAEPVAEAATAEEEPELTAEPETETVEVAENVTAEVEMPEDPNAQLSPDQIAALFAAVEPVAEAATAEEEPELTAEPEAETAKVAENVTAEVEMPEDPNAQLSPDQIAALFAAANG